MYQNGINKTLWETLQKIKNDNNNLNLLFSKTEIHSKAYIWKKEGKIISALIGSANFSSNGLRNDYREILADATRDTFQPLNDYYEFIKKNSTTKPQINKIDNINNITLSGDKNKNIKYDLKYSCEIPLYSINTGDVHEKGGLNWGLSLGHVAKGDAYIALPKKIIQENMDLIKPYDENYISPQGKKRNSEPVEIIWDDGYIMDASFEGVNNIDDKKFPKQLSSYSAEVPYLNGEKISKKSILGRYIRKRINVDINHKITMKDLNKYGRNTITLSLIENGIYYADFSV